MINDDPILQIKRLDSGYGKKQVLFGISLSVHPGEIIAFIGPNGAGKSTILKVVHGLLAVWSGEIIFESSLMNNISPAVRVSQGITFAPQGNRVFGELTVIENLEIGGCQLTKKELKPRIEEVLQFFPLLANRRNQIAGQLSGGERQMLALGRALVPRPKLLMLDEPSLGLSPNLVSQIFDKIKDISNTTGTTILIVEQRVREVLGICHRVYSLKLGQIAYEGSPSQLLENKVDFKKLFL